MPGLGEIIYESQIWKSVFRHPMPVDRRNRIVVMLTNFFLHLHPVSIKKQGIALSYTWCMARATPLLGHEGPGHQLLTLGYPMITPVTDARFALLGARNVGEETLNRFYI